MKKFCFILLLNLVSQSYAQIKVTPPIAYVRDDAMSYKERFVSIPMIGIDTIDAQGFARNGSFKALDSLFTAHPMQNYYEYDNQNRRINHQAWKVYNGVKKYFTDERIKYNSKNQLVSYEITVQGSFEERFDSMKVSHQDLYYYNNHDSISIKKIKRLDSYGNWADSIKFTFEYNGFNKISRKTSSKWNLTDWIIFEDQHFVYGNATSPDTIFYNNKRQLIFKNRLGKDSLILFQKYSVADWITASRDSFTYDSLQRLVAKLSYRWINSNWEHYPSKALQWTYDSNNRLIFVENYLGNDEGIEARFTYYEDDKVKSWSYGHYYDFFYWAFVHNYSYRKIELPSLNTTFDFSIYPNPVHESIKLLGNFSESRNYSIRLFSALGNLIKEETIFVYSGFSELTIALNNISKGLYFIEISNEESKMIKKVIIEL